MAEKVKIRLNQDTADGKKGDIVKKDKATADILTNEGLGEMVDENVEELGEETENSGGDFEVEAHPGGLPEGKHAGAIVDLEKKEAELGKGKTATYLDIHMDVPEEDVNESKVGYPLNITPGSRLGKLVKRFGHEIEVGKSYDLEEILVGSKVTFLVQEDENGYTNVVHSSLKPA